MLLDTSPEIMQRLMVSIQEECVIFPSFMGLCDMPMLGGQDGTYHRDGPQPLGVFSEARVHPVFHFDNAVENVLEISKTGLLLELVDTTIYPGEAASDASSSSDITDSSEDDVWAVGLRLARCAV